MEEKFLEKLHESFPSLSFKLVTEKAVGLPFGEKEKETLLINETPIELSWAPILSKCPEEYFDHFWSTCHPAIKKVVTDKKKTKAYKMLEKFKKKYVDKKEK
tara:strand:- start:8328 stop:8633 length:306 start_codon:yes stop_codon:yes gene_type:complete